MRTKNANLERGSMSRNQFGHCERWSERPRELFAVPARIFILLVAAGLLVSAAQAQTLFPRSNSDRAQSRNNAPRGYEADLDVVRDAQERALEQAKEMVAQTQNATDRAALETAIKEMERAQEALEKARSSPAELPAAIAAEQAAYQALLRATPREFRVSQSRNGQRGQRGNAARPNQRQLDQLEMTREDNRYETERQATTPQNQQQREQLQIADRLRELAQRQQDLNERLRELQNALQAARTEQEREEIQRQLKRLRDEQRQMLAEVDELRQNMEQSPNANSLAEAREQLDQTRSDMQRAAEELERQSPSQALAAGSRAEQSMENLRDDLRQQGASQFAEQMRDLRNEARELAREQEQIARDMEALEQGPRRTIDDSSQRQQIAERMAQQQAGLTNILSNMRDVIESSENTEPLLSRQLYDTLRRADQNRTDNLLEMSSQLVDKGFLPQASEVERTVRQNINDLRQGIERAAESVLGSEADALRFAERELEELERQVEREFAAGRTNAPGQLSGAPGSEAGSNALARAMSSRAGTNSVPGVGTNQGPATLAGGQEGDEPGARNQLASARNQGRPNGQESDQQGNQGEGQQQEGQQQGRGQAQGEQQGQGQGEQQQTAQGQQPGEGQRPGQGQQQAQSGQRGQGRGQQQGQRGQQGEGQQQGQQPGEGQPNEGQALAQDQQGQSGGGGGQGGDQQDQEGDGEGRNMAERLRDLVQQLGRSGNGGGRGGPITGDNFLDWAERLRDVERAVDQEDLRNQLANVRERATDLRREYRELGSSPSPDKLQKEILMPMTQVRTWLREALARHENARSLVPLDRDPVPDAYSELVRKYYENLGSAQ